MEKDTLLNCGIERKNCPICKYPNVGLSERVECRQKMIYMISQNQTAKETVLGTCRMLYGKRKRSI